MFVRSEDRAGAWRWAVVVGLFALALAHCILRGPVVWHGFINLCDFASPWASSRLWLTGLNPYETDRLWDTWISGRGAFETDHDFWLALMPPGCLLVLSPLAALEPGPASVMFGLISLASIVIAIVCVLRLADIPGNSWLAWFIAALAVASAPFQTLLAVGQLSLPTIALIFLAIVLDRQGKQLIAGLLLGVAITIKPQLAGPFLLWFLLYGRWRALVPAAVIPVLLNLAAIIPMEMRGIPWLRDYQLNVITGTLSGAPNDPTAANPWRHQIIDLRLWLHTLFGQHRWITAKGLVISMLMISTYVMLAMRLREPKDRLLSLAVLCGLTLLPVYHRIYDAALLLPGLAWALLALRSAQRTPAIAVLAAMSLFLVPFDFLVLVRERTTALEGITHLWIWRAFISPHHAFATVVTAACLLWGMTSRAVEERAILPRAMRQEPGDELVDLASSR